MPFSGCGGQFHAELKNISMENISIANAGSGLFEDLQKEGPFAALQSSNPLQVVRNLKSLASPRSPHRQRARLHGS